MVDFDAAVSGRHGRDASGSRPPYDTQGFDRVLAVGVRAATPAAEGPAARAGAAREAQVTAHGCAILRRRHADQQHRHPGAAGSRPHPMRGSCSRSRMRRPTHAREGAARDLRWLAREPPARPRAASSSSRLPDAARTDIGEALAMNHAAVAGHAGRFRRRLSERRRSVRRRRSTCTTSSSAWVSGRGRVPGAARRPSARTGSW